MRSTRLALVAVAAVSLLAGCGGKSGTSGGTAVGGFNPPNIPAQKSLGPGEGQVNLVSWAGYVEDGSDNPSLDWVHPFEKQTGCKVNNKVAGTSDEMVSLMKTGQYDAVSASGDASLRLIASGTVAPVNTSLVPNYADVFPDLKNKPWNSVNGKMYGIPHGRGANMLMYRTDKVNPAPTSWGAVFDPNSPYKGHITAYDSPIYIADAALYLMATQPDLDIKDPYALDQHQFDAAVNLLKEQKNIVGEYWSDATKTQQSFKSGDTLLGTTWQVIANGLTAEKVPVQTVLPKEGATGWSDTWMVAAKAQHPNCAYQWMNWVISPQVNAEIAESWGEAPANSKACALTKDKTFCDVYHAADTQYWTKVHYWNTPIAQCLDGRKNVQCVDYSKWTQAWTTIKG